MIHRKLFSTSVLIILIPLLSIQYLNAQSRTTDSILKSVDERIISEHLELLTEFLSIPNDANYPEQIEQNLQWLANRFEELDFETGILKTQALPLFFAEKRIDENLPTILFYMHFDGQPVDSSKWDQENPYDPVIKMKSGNNWVEVDNVDIESLDDDWRIFARSASDDKGPIAMFLSAMQVLQAKGLKSKFNIKVILDSMEEKGSPVLASAVADHKEVLASDYLVVFDGPMHDSGLPTLLYGVRGITRMRIEIYGPSKPQHSGHFGNYAPNPVFRAAELLATMKDEEGKVIIPGFYDGIILDKNAKEIMSAVPDDEKGIQQRAGFAQPEKVGENYQESIQYPSLSVLGIQSGWVDSKTRTIVPDKVIVEMDIRTVPESDSNRLIELVKKHIESQGFTILDHTPDEAEMLTIAKPIYFQANPLMFSFRTPIDSEIGNWLREAVYEAHQKEIVQIRISGGSVPLSFFINELDIPAVLVPLVNPDNNQHSPNENLRLGNYFDGIRTIVSILNHPIRE
ncbi:MAG: M20/M25/M40 family metallo-hydrolase [Balneolaceae bacterium]|nr:M20/M25/M40 family metallo-hydrolase [Balneolaceae bacterium]MBO6547840.1 M20/M25/M40 family metallo-hydrolase [Balneolaceae bacterium]MBO6648351.1 M20/M25/M40 family metallo-hydrolase [Balneolaceae bacterium]